MWGWSEGGDEMTVRKLKELLNKLSDDWEVVALYEDTYWEDIVKGDFKGFCINSQTKEYYFIVDPLLVRPFKYIAELFDIPFDDLWFWDDYENEEKQD
ncbi:MAG: hypothetical protein DRP24_06735 [Thermotoga sp.]|nr:MAG: hypothetical protein DRP24_06735 [Thermotoga sp.]